MELPVEVRTMLEGLDSVTYNHSLRVWKLALLMEAGRGTEAGYGTRDHRLSNAALVHDIGKLYIPGRILDKHGALDALEREVMGLHPYLGYRLLGQYGACEEVKRLVLYHHGMEPKLLGPLPGYDTAALAEEARVLHTIDAFEALTTDRPYRRRMSVLQAAAFLGEQGGYHPGALAFLEETVLDF